MTTPAPSNRDLRAWTTFDAKSQAALRAGQVVTGGDGRRFQLINGHATVVGSATYRAARPDSTPDRWSATEDVKQVVDIVKPQEGTDAQRDALAALKGTLGDYGLETLADWAWKQILEGRSEAEIARDIRETPEFKERFPAIEERTKKGLAPISPGEYVAYERQARQVMRQAGLPETFYDSPDDFRRFLAGDVSISELNDRIQLGRQAAYEAPPEVRAALERDYGITEGALTAFFLDPDRAQPLLEKGYRSAQIGGAAERTGFGRTTRAQNEELATLGVTAEQAAEGFGRLADSRELFVSLDRGEDAIDTDTQLGAAFKGNSAAQRRIAIRTRRRQAEFEGGGGFAGDQRGLTGLGRTDG